MAKTKISEWSSTSADNTDISNINIAEGCSPANVNNAIRTVMAQVKDLQAGTSGDTIPVAAGGTGSTTATAARTALSAAASGANSDITSLSGLTTALSVAQGGTGSTTATGSGAVVLTTSPSIASPTLTGTPVAPTATSGTNTTQVATTAFVQTATPYATSTVKGMVRVSVSGTTLNIYTTA